MSRNEPRAAPESLLAQIVEASEDAILSGTVDGTVLSWNPAAERMFGWTKAEMLGNNSMLLIPPELREEQQARIERMKTGFSVRVYETHRMHKDGRRIPVQVTLFPLHEADGGIARGAAILRDLTAQRESESRVRTLEADNAHFGRLIEMGQMSAAIAHELNQPLAAIANYLAAARNLVQSGANLETLIEIMDKASRQTKRAGKVLRVLRDFLEKRETRVVAQDLNTVVRDAVAMASMGEDSVAMNLDLADDLPEVPLDQIQIQQVLVNLIRNGIEAMADSEVRELSIRTGRTKDNAVIVIRDTGPGLSKDVREKLFDAFVTTKPKGMGIGLSICRSILETHGGKICVLDSKVGAVFEITLPLVSRL